MLFVCNAMSIKSFVYYNHSNCNYNGYINYDKGIAVSYENAVAKGALVFVLVSF